MPSPLAARLPTRRDAFSWISLGVMASACVLWLTFARTERVVAIAFSIRPGQPIYSIDFVWHRVLAVWSVGVAVAVALILGGIVLRKQPIDGRSAVAWLHLTSTLATVLAVLAIAREIRGRPVTADMWFVFAGVAMGVVAPFWRERRESLRRGSSRAS